METLTTASPTATLDVTAGAYGVIATSGIFNGGRVNISYALTGATTVFAPLLGGSFDSHFQAEILYPGAKLKFELVGGDVDAGQDDTEINIEVTDAA